ncbi:MAG: ArsR family transcriptional regulator, partial [Candidatus Heimdallarchaeota archaeon]|nr:ArsR family transcriptional regulator [Candidatus Heimdallarchaeota archaeon]
LTFRSLNLTNISQLIGKSKSTTIEHLKILVEEGYIEFDSSSTEWGKFYRPTLITIAISRYFDSETEEMNLDQEIDRLRKLSDDDFVLNRLTHYRKNTPKNDYQSIKFIIEVVNELNANIHRIAVKNIQRHLYNLEILSLVNSIQKNGFDEKEVIRTFNNIKQDIPSDNLSKLLFDVDTSDEQEIFEVCKKLIGKQLYPVIDWISGKTDFSKEFLPLLPMGEHTDWTTQIRIGSVDQFLRFIKLLISTVKQFKVLKAEIDEENQQNAISNKQTTVQYLNIFTSNLDIPE